MSDLKEMIDYLVKYFDKLKKPKVEDAPDTYSEQMQNELEPIEEIEDE